MPDRIIKESICTSDTLNQLSDFEERFWNRLIVNCDDYGRFDARPAILKGRLFPLMENKTHKDMTGALNKLASVGLVELYEVDGKPFLRVVKWDKYQRIRAKRSKFPAPDETCCQMTADDGKCPRNPIQSNPNPNANAYSSVGADVPTLEQVTEYAKFNRFLSDPKEFFDYYAANNWHDSEGKPVYSWQQKFRAWEIRTQDKIRKSGKSGDKGGDYPDYSYKGDSVVC